jgi:simple sugar transport system substrate-binding protein
MLQNLARAVLLAGLALAATAAETPPLKVAFVYVSPVGEAGWTYQHDQGRRAMEQALAPRVRTTVVESVAEGPDAERVMRDLAQQGHRLIFATSFGYLEPALRVAAEFPGVAIEQTGGYKTAVNVNTYNARYYEARYLAGLLAGKMSPSGVAGYVAGFPVPEVIQGINAFTLGMRAANPKASVKLVWLDAWFDPARERDAATALVNQGVDVLTNHSGSTAVAQVAEERRVGFIAYQSDMRALAPRAQWTAIVHQWGGYYTSVAQKVLQGSWRVAPVWGGMKGGFVRLAPFGAAVPADVAALVRAREADLVAGRLHAFGGRIVDNTGRERQPAQARTMPDARIQAMDFLVEGVSGSLPQR